MYTRSILNIFQFIQKQRLQEIKTSLTIDIIIIVVSLNIVFEDYRNSKLTCTRRTPQQGMKGRGRFLVKWSWGFTGFKTLLHVRWHGVGGVSFYGNKHPIVGVRHTFRRVSIVPGNGGWKRTTTKYFPVDTGIGYAYISIMFTYSDIVHAINRRLRDIESEERTLQQPFTLHDLVTQKMSIILQYNFGGFSFKPILHDSCIKQMFTSHTYL